MRERSDTCPFFLLCLLVCVIWVSACGREARVDLEFIPYTKRFQSEAVSRGNRVTMTGLSVEFYESRGKELARCIHDEQRVQIDREFWNSRSNSDRELIIFHELGHCVLGRQHEQATSSIMVWNPDNLRTDYQHRRKMFLDELFRQ